MAWKDFRKVSRGGYGCECKDGDNRCSTDKVNAGSLQRIADSLEHIEKPYLKLIDDAESLRRLYQENINQIERLRRSNAALRGQITKMKKALSRES